MYAEADASMDDGAAPLPATRRATWLLAIAPVGAFAAQFAETNSYYTTLTRVYTGLLAAVTAYALARCLVLRPQRIPAIEYGLLYYYLNFGLAATVAPQEIGPSHYLPHADACETAAAFALVAGIAMLAGHAVWSAVPGADARRRYLPNLTPQMIDSISVPYVLVGATLLVAFALAPGIKVRIISVLSIVQLLIGAGPVGVVATLAYALRPRVRTLTLVTLAVGAMVLSMVVSGMLGEALMPIVAVATVWWRQRGKFPVVLAMCAIAIFFVLQPVKFYYRMVKWDGHNADVGVVSGWQQAFSAAGSDRNKQSGADAARDRMSELSGLAYVMELVPDTLPYFGGDVYGRAITAMIPRVLWPDKPNMTKEGLDPYTIALGFIDAKTAETSTTGVEIVTHGYASHGLVGGIGWMALYGLVVGAVNRFFGRGIAGTIAMTGFMIEWIPTIALGFVGCFGILPQVVVSLVILLWSLWLLARLAQTKGAGESLGVVTRGLKRQSR